MSMRKSKAIAVAASTTATLGVGMGAAIAAQHGAHAEAHAVRAEATNTLSRPKAPVIVKYVDEVVTDPAPAQVHDVVGSDVHHAATPETDVPESSAAASTGHVEAPDHTVETPSTVPTTLPPVTTTTSGSPAASAGEQENESENETESHDAGTGSESEAGSGTGDQSVHGSHGGHGGQIGRAHV